MDNICQGCAHLRHMARYDKPLRCMARPERASVTPPLCEDERREDRSCGINARNYQAGANNYSTGRRLLDAIFG